MRKMILIVLCAIFVEGCVSSPQSPAPIPTSIPSHTPSPTSTPTEIPTPTDTPIPDYTLSGTVFFDYNGSGEQDLAYGMYAEDSVEEPGIAGVQVCLDGRSDSQSCRISDDTGFYSFDGVSTGMHRILIESPTDDPATAFRYINISHGWVDIPAYEMNGVQVPAQHLPDTEIHPIDKFITIDLEQDTLQDVALMQGFLTLPYIEHDGHELEAITHFDHDPIVGKVLNYAGDSDFWYWRSEPPAAGTGDGHTGVDFGLPYDTFLVAAIPGLMTHEFTNPDNNARVARLTNMDVHFGSQHYVVITYGHHSEVLVNGIPTDSWNDWTGVKVYRGQIILLSGMTGNTHWPHLHFGFHGNSLPDHGEEFMDFDPFAIEYATSTSLENIGAWTVRNIPMALMTLTE